MGGGRREMFDAKTSTFGKRGHVNFTHLRIYISKRALTSSTKERLRPRLACVNE